MGAEPQRSTRCTPRQAWALLATWGVAACLLSGAAAELLGLPSLWAHEERFLEYALPVPFAWGLLHWPSLVVFGLALVAAAREPERWVVPLRLVGAGALLGVATTAGLSEPLREFPPLLYVAADASTALVASAVLTAPATRLAWPLAARAALLLGPALLAAAAVGLGPLLGPRYRVAQDETLDLAPGRDVVRVWAYPARGVTDPAAECPHLASLAREYGERRPRRNGERQISVLLFRDLAELQRSEAEDAWLSYDRWPDGRALCSADPAFRPDR